MFLGQSWLPVIIPCKGAAAAAGTHRRRLALHVHKKFHTQGAEGASAN